ncbi:MAG: restriction endonuclease subunit S [Termitinemataceae bacterium]|nr:MAG: restriction endonuclease subunit S [Termitinemataceae bacterium]
MKVDDLFILHQGNGFELINMDVDNSSEINFVARTSENNGVVAKIKAINNISPFPAGYITVALGGSVLSSFVQNKSFYTGFHIMALQPKIDMSLEKKLFYCHCIKMNAYRYRYGRQANKTLKDIELPELPNWLQTYTIDYSRTTTQIEKKEIPIDVSKWRRFKIGDLFAILSCKCSNAGQLSDGQDVFYIGAKKNDNGIMKKVLYDENLITKGNCIVFICDGQGSVGYSNYMNMNFIGSTTLSVGYNNYLNKYIGLFIVSILDLEKPKYSYGRKYKKYLSETQIKLPADENGEPDWQFMENYIKALPYSDKI